MVSPAVIEVLWRPGCPFCARLCGEPALAGVATAERDIWSDPDAAARVRAARGGEETVPTVVVGECALVNRSLAQSWPRCGGSSPTRRTPCWAAR